MKLEHSLTPYTKKKIQKNKQKPRDLCDSNTIFNIYVIGILELEEKKYSLKKVFEEEMAENFPISSKDINL